MMWTVIYPGQGKKGVFDGMAKFDATAVLQRLGSPLRELCCDSRRLVAGDAFLAYPGEQVDGRQYIPQAVSAGASAVFWEPSGFSWPAAWQTPNVAVPELRARAGWLADAVYGAPSAHLFVAAITGTNGKTTVAHLTAALLRQSGRRAAVLGTLGAGEDDNNMKPTANTTPEAVELQRHLRDFVRLGAAAAIIEASSHGIAQQRLAGVRLTAAAFCNAGRDHLDYHGSETAYHQCKASLFTAPDLQTGVFNADDDFCAETARRLADKMCVRTFGVRGDSLKLTARREDDAGQELELDGSDGRRLIRLPFGGAHNASNFMAAALLARAAGATWDSLTPAALTLPNGRLQQINADGAPAVYVDYAHTPEALAAVLKTLTVAARRRGGRLRLVFGCGGERDIGKRKQMAAAAMAADVVFVTDDNPRGEDAAAIRACLTAVGGGDFADIPQREEAIDEAIAGAAVADIVLIAGKGHETYQETALGRRHFSDAEEARHALARRTGGSC